MIFLNKERGYLYVSMCDYEMVQHYGAQSENQVYLW